MDRRSFLKRAGWAAAGTAVGAPALAAVFGRRRFAGGSRILEWKPRGEKPRSPVDLVVVRGKDPAKMAEAGLEAIGALEKFLSRGDNVLVKPNVAWDRLPEQAANTNPELVASLVRLAYRAGARSVTVADHPCNAAANTFERSGIRQAAEDAGARVALLGERDFVPVRLGGRAIDVWEAYADYPKFDKVINVPIAKHHSLAGLTLSLKSYFGLAGGRRRDLHQNIDDTISDLAAFFTRLRPTLTVLDAVRILLRNGPQGGRMEDVREANTLVVGYDPASVDAFGTTLFDLAPERIGHVKTAVGRGLGSLDLRSLKVKEIRA
jgi:uncharacterized protein (DUF362 family)